MFNLISRLFAWVVQHLVLPLLLAVVLMLLKNIFIPQLERRIESHDCDELQQLCLQKVIMGQTHCEMLRECDGFRLPPWTKICKSRVERRLYIGNQVR